VVEAHLAPERVPQPVPSITEGLFIIMQMSDELMEAAQMRNYCTIKM
jgi:hypothetical protein